MNLIENAMGITKVFRHIGDNDGVGAAAREIHGEGRVEKSWHLYELKIRK